MAAFAPPAWLAAVFLAATAAGSHGPHPLQALHRPRTVVRDPSNAVTVTASPSVVANSSQTVMVAWSTVDDATDDDWVRGGVASANGRQCVRRAGGRVRGVDLGGVPPVEGRRGAHQVSHRHRRGAGRAEHGVSSAQPVAPLNCARRCWGAACAGPPRGDPNTTHLRHF